MNLKNQPPILMPAEFVAEFEQLSKAALLDLVWWKARDGRTKTTPDTEVARELRTTAKHVTDVRQLVKKRSKP